jgi:hypothetical protein
MQLCEPLALHCSVTFCPAATLDGLTCRLTAGFAVALTAPTSLLEPESGEITSPPQPANADRAVIAVRASIRRLILDDLHAALDDPKTCFDARGLPLRPTTEFIRSP